MGIWGKRRQSGLDSKLKDYDHSVAFTLESNDQFTLQVPTPKQQQQQLVGVDISSTHASVSHHGHHDEKDVISTVSSITSHSSDGSSSSSSSCSVSTYTSSSLNQVTSNDLTMSTTKRQTIVPEKETCFASFLIDLCGYGGASDWCPACADVQPTPSMTSDYDVFAPPSRDDYDVYASSPSSPCCSWPTAAEHDFVQEIPVKKDNDVYAVQEKDKYAVHDDIEKKDQQQKVQQHKSRKHKRRQQRKNKKKKKKHQDKANKDDQAAAPKSSKPKSNEKKGKHVFRSFRRKRPSSSAPPAQ